MGQSCPGASAWRFIARLSAFGCAWAVLWITPTHAEQDPIATERSILEAIQSVRAKERQAKVPKAPPREGAGEGEAQPEAEGESLKQRRWAILPEVGYSPEAGANGGVKFTDRDITPLHLTLDVGGRVALKGQQHLDAILLSPSFGTDWLMLFAEGEYYTDPTKEFFGLGNNDVGPDELSTNRYQRTYGTLALALRASRRFTLVVSGAYKYVAVSRGHLTGSTPSTPSLFPDLAGVAGGRSSPLTFAMSFDNRDDLTRPTRGWSIIAKASWVPNGLGNDFDYARYTLDGSYLYPLFARRQVIGLHVGGGYVDAQPRRVPFYDLASLGGSRDLRGYFHDRFLGGSNVVINAEYRLKLFDFNFFDLWQVRIDGVAFGDTGRVFYSEEDIARELGEPVASIPPTNNHFRWSYGGGTRIALSEALVARIDVGFSDEEKGLVYLVFGHTF